MFMCLHVIFFILMSKAVNDLFLQQQNQREKKEPENADENKNEKKEANRKLIINIFCFIVLKGLGETLTSSVK